MRAPEPLGDDPALHRCVIAHFASSFHRRMPLIRNPSRSCVVAYGSDFALLETALLPHATAILNSQARACSA